LGSPTARTNQGKPEFPEEDEDDEYLVFVNSDFVEFVEKLCEHPATWELFPLEGIFKTSLKLISKFRKCR
jgi:hypothetical protein